MAPPHGLDPGLAGLADVQRQLRDRVLADSDCTGHTLDIDAKQIVAEKESLHRTYQGEQGYMPMVGHLAETSLVIGDAFRHGNDAPAARHRAFIRQCDSQLPQGHRMAAIRADSAAYQADILNACEANGQSFAIGAVRDLSVNAAITAIPEADWQPRRDGEIAETVHCMSRTEHAFRLIVVRRGNQGELFVSEISPYRYAVIASNRNEGGEATMAWHC